MNADGLRCGGRQTALIGDGPCSGEREQVGTLAVAVWCIIINRGGDNVFRADRGYARFTIVVRVDISGTLYTAVSRGEDGWSWFVSSDVNVLGALGGFSGDAIDNRPCTNNVSVRSVSSSSESARGDNLVGVGRN